MFLTARHQPEALLALTECHTCVVLQFDDSDAKAIAARLGQYINQHLYRRVPDGQQLPTHDESTDAGLYT